MIICLFFFAVLAGIFAMIISSNNFDFKYSTDYWWSCSGQKIKNVVVARLASLEKQGKVAGEREVTSNGITKVTHWIPLVPEEEIIEFLSRPVKVYQEGEA